jgi:hypothetical protein
VIIRAGTICGNSITGAVSTTDFLNKFIAGIVQLGLFPEVDSVFDMAPGTKLVFNYSTGSQVTYCRLIQWIMWHEQLFEWLPRQRLPSWYSICTTLKAHPRFQKLPKPSIRMDSQLLQGLTRNGKFNYDKTKLIL